MIGRIHVRFLSQTARLDEWEKRKKDNLIFENPLVKGYGYLCGS